MDLSGERFAEDHGSESGFWIRCLKKVIQFATRSGDWHWRCWDTPNLGLVDHGPQFHCELAMALSCFVGCDLHRNRKEVIVVAIEMRLQQRLEVLGVSHRVSPSVERFAISYR